MKTFFESLTPGLVLIITILFLFLGGYAFKFQHFNFYKIIKDYTGCYKGIKAKIGMVIIIVILPGYFAWIAKTKNSIDESTINIITIIVSVLTSMLFTLITLFAGMKEKFEKEKDNAVKRATLLELIKQTYKTVMFEILISIIILLFCFMTIFSSEISSLDSWIIYYFSFVLILNLFMILKRLSYLFDEWLE